jgi:CDGSH iron-sulfur domain-containing protein 3
MEASADKRVVIKVRNNGPYKVTGPVTIIDADGNEFELPEGDGVVLCRCGASTTKPFCDKTHSKIGFEAAERAVREEGLGDLPGHLPRKSAPPGG